MDTWQPRYRQPGGSRQPVLVGAGRRNLHGRVVEIAGVRIAGLGGVFRGEVWHPPEVRYESFAALKASQSGRPMVKAQRSERDRKHQSTIFPDVYNKLVGKRADILVTHEAPSCHPHGFAVIDDLARRLGVHTSLHAHHHDRLDYAAYFGRLRFKAFGVGFCGITDQDGQIIREGDFDRLRGHRQERVNAGFC